MDVIIYTSDPSEVDANEVAEALQAANYFVMSVTIKRRSS